jgi:starch synthase
VYGGAGVHVDYLSRELAKEIEVEVHCWGSQNSNDGNLHVRGAEPWQEITNGTEGKFKSALEALSLNLTQVKSLTGVDIVHTHTWYMSMAGYFAKKLYSIPFVLTTHSLEPLRAWKAEQLGRGYVLSSWMERTAILDADAIIAVSQGTRADILRVYPEVKAERIFVIYNGIDLAEYKKTSETRALADYGVDPAIPYILFVGRVTRQKGVTHLVDAIRYLPRETQVVLCAGAPDTPEIASELRWKVENARAVHPRIIWIEKIVTKAEAIQLYSNARVFCCPSVYEPFGIINLEAMACCAPVVASATGGIKEVVVDGETGYLVPFDQDPVTTFPVDPEKFARDLASGLNRLLQDPERCRRFGDAGRRRVEEIFSWTAIAQQTIRLYKQLIQQSATSAKI